MLLAKQHRASSSETPTHNSKNRQASSRAVLPSVPFVYRRPVAPEKNSNSTFSGSSQPLLLFTVSPAVENMRSDWACVAGIARTRRATRARYGNSMALLRHMSSGLLYTAFIRPLASAFSLNVAIPPAFLKRARRPIRSE